MTITININGLTLCHRGSSGISRNTLPDVCKTPSKGIPLPYSNTAYSADLSKGTTSVFADDGNMIANNGSIFARSTGDEGGSMGGIKSGTHLAEAEWLTHSFDVFFEKKGACRLTDKMFMNHRNTVNMAGLWQRQLSPELVDKICEAICDCNTAKNTVLPSTAQVGEAVEEGLDALRGIADTTKEQASASNEIHRRQDCFVGHFADGNPWFGPTSKDPKVLMEVPFNIPTDVKLSETGRTTFSGGPTAPMSPVRAVSQARASPGTTVIWDMVTVNNPNLPATWSNIDKVIEVKFAGDKWTQNQDRARKHPAVARKLVRVDEADCDCGREEEERKREINRIIKESGESARKMAPLFGPPGLRGPMPGAI